MQALIEFLDLANFNPMARNRWRHNNHLYFEAISWLRDATVGVLIGSPRASTGLFGADRLVERPSVLAVANPATTAALASQVCKQSGEYVRQATGGAQANATVQ